MVDVLQAGPPQAKQGITQTLRHWKADTDLAGIRDEPALPKLPDAEHKACRAFWAEVDGLLKKCSDAKR